MDRIVFPIELFNLYLDEVRSNLEAGRLDEAKSQLAKLQDICRRQVARTDQVISLRQLSFEAAKASGQN